MAKQGLTNEVAEDVAPPTGEEAAQRIWDTIRRIPPGQVSSYGEIAGRAGLPGRARLVGKVLGQVPEGLEVPWFRVLRSDGRIAFPPQSAPYREQRARLIGEGVRVERGRVRLDDFGWGRNLDRELWAPPPESGTARRAKKPAGPPSAASKRSRTAAAKAAASATPARSKPVAAASKAARKSAADRSAAGKLSARKRTTTRRKS